MMSPEDTLREALDELAGRNTPMWNDALGAFHDILTERDRLARDCDSLRLERDGLEYVRVKDNGYLLERISALEDIVVALIVEAEHDWARGNLLDVLCDKTGAPRHCWLNPDDWERAVRDALKGNA